MELENFKNEIKNLPNEIITENEQVENPITCGSIIIMLIELILVIGGGTYLIYFLLKIIFIILV